MTSKGIDYLAIGHVTRDLREDGFTLGGTVAYAGLTAATLGRTVGIVTSCDESMNLSPLSDLHINRIPSQVSTTFENLYHGGMRKQRLHSISLRLGSDSVPTEWRSARLVHLAPVVNEVDPGLVQIFDESFIGITPQGWMRRWDRDGSVHYLGWNGIIDVLPDVDAVVISIEDLQGDEEQVIELSQHCGVLAVTRSEQGATIHVQGEQSTIEAPTVKEVDPTGSGDIFAAVFFSLLQDWGDPIEAAVWATKIASQSISGSGLKSIPNLYEIREL